MAAPSPSAVLTRAITDRPAGTPLPPPSTGSGLYLLLALALGGMVVLSLVVNGQIEQSVFKSVATSELWAHKFGDVSSLGSLAISLDAPGNDVFLNRAIRDERLAMRTAFDSITVRLALVRRTLPIGLAPRQAALLLTDIDRISTACNAL